MARSKVQRRDFLKTSAVGVTAMTLTAASARRVYGANERIGVAFVGVGGRCQAHLDILNELKKENKAEPIAVCDVWDGYEGTLEITSGGVKTSKKYAQGLY